MPIDLLGQDKGNEKELFEQKEQQAPKEMEMKEPGTEKQKPPEKTKKSKQWGSFFKKKPKKDLPAGVPGAGEKGVSGRGTGLLAEESEAEGLDISLMPGRAMVIPRTVRSSFLIFLATLIIVLTIFILVWLYTSWNFEKIASSIHEIQGEMQLLEAESTFFLETRNEVASLETKAARVEEILNKHVYWTKFFTLLETYTARDVYFGDFTANTGGSIHLETTARDLTSIAKQIVAFKQADDFVKKVEVAGIRKLPIGIKASFDLVLIDDVFYK